MKWGVIWEDGKMDSALGLPKKKSFLLKKKRLIIGTIPPTPACKRALSQVISALKKQGHEVVDLYVYDFFFSLPNFTNLVFFSS